MMYVSAVLSNEAHPRRRILKYNQLEASETCPSYNVIQYMNVCSWASCWAVVEDEPKLVLLEPYKAC